MPCEVLSNVDNLTIRSWLTCSFRLRISTSSTCGRKLPHHASANTYKRNQLHMWTEIAAAFEKNIAFSCLKCYNRYIPETKGGVSMPRPPQCRRICDVPQVDTFCPNGCENTEPILLTLDEYEVIRLVDLEQQTHEQCAAQMDISRSTVQEIYEVARRKIAACLVHGKSLHITGGNYRICGGQDIFRAKGH